MKKYTYREILDKIALLKEIFPIVRLVNPLSCSVAEIIEKDGICSLSYSGNCFEVWEKSHQCANCTSMRALQMQSKCTKCELLGNDVFYITSCPVEVEGNSLVLEMVQNINNELEEADIEHLRNAIEGEISNTGENCIRDAETYAFNRLYLLEHLSNILLEARQAKRGSACMVQIQQFHDICKLSGRMAGLGLACTLYGILKSAFSDIEDTYIIRYSDDTFIVMNTSLSRSDFRSIVHNIEKETAFTHILFNNGRMPFAIRISDTDIFAEDIMDEESLIKKLTDSI